MTMNRREMLSGLGMAVSGLTLCAVAPLAAQAAFDKGEDKYNKLVEDLGGQEEVDRMVEARKTKSNKIVVWKLGSMEHNLHPTEAAIQRFADVISKQQEQNPNGLDLIWGPELNVEVQELVINSEYDAITRDIYKGLGIPRQLVTGV